jgi:hypothetical protein
MCRVALNRREANREESLCRYSATGCTDIFLSFLQELKVLFNNLQYLAGVVHVSSLTRLTSLTVDGRSMEGMMDHVLLEVKCEQVS